MTTMSPDERRAKSDALHKAIEEYLDGQGFEGLLSDWLLIGSVVKIDDDGDPNCTYFVAFSGGSMLQHHALGLLAKGEDVLTGEDQVE